MTGYFHLPEVTLQLSTLNEDYHFSLSTSHLLKPRKGSFSCVFLYALYLVTWGPEEGR